MGALLTLFDDDGFNPRRLFLSSTIGAIYAYDDFAYLYQKTDGTTPVTALEQPVGLLVDQRYGGAVGATELITAEADRTFSSSTGFWDGNAGVTVASGAANWQATPDTYALYTSSNTFTSAGKYYEVTWTISSISSGGIRAGVGSVNGVTRTTPGTYTDRIIAGSASGRLSFSCVGTTTASIDNVSLKEVPGLHAYQSTDAARHTLKGTPRYGLFDRVDDHLLVATGGGSTTGFMLAGSIQPATDGVARTIFSDRGTNTGYKVEIDATNKLLFTAGNGTAYTTCTGPTLTAGTNYAFCVWHDGANLNIKVGTAATVSQAFATATAGTSTLTLFKDNDAASGYFSGRLYALTYIRNASINDGIASQLIGWAAAKGGFAP